MKRKAFKLPARATPWVSPRPPARLLIDDEIDLLRERKRRPRLRANHELRHLGIRCPYYHVRHWLYLVDARSEMSASVAAMRRDYAASLERTRDKTADLARALAGFDADAALNWGGPLPGPFFDRFDSKTYNARSSVVYQHLGAIKTATAAAADLVRLLQEDMAVTSPSGAPIGEKAVFAHAMGICWRNLTGDDPAPSPAGPFVDFVAAAAASISTTAGGNVSWERAVRTACAHAKRRPAFDRFDRHERRMTETNPAAPTEASRNKP